ncbi:hypothetical protein K458DRAFT_405837 [Lentithecium fluviatile CBS 122367]|uniref:Uncharacterized protein n=1 Tax=Lentithecium fluviatile CBS 122367 TaxID=1168545 RepID=A0A6G1IVB5_9PLEO|nr:hypothetical protein K458DRAFT_405837 [Lentithecium fluviatile CBS 122367]
MSTPHRFQELTVRHTTFSELHQHALESYRAAYQALPHHDTLQFETLDAEGLSILFPTKAGVHPIRLVLGYKGKSRKGTTTTVYVYICEKDHINEGFARLGNTPLRVQGLDDINFDRPFDHIYDLYGMRGRTLDSCWAYERNHDVSGFQGCVWRVVMEDQHYYSQRGYATFWETTSSVVTMRKRQKSRSPKDGSDSGETLLDIIATNNVTDVHAFTSGMPHEILSAETDDEVGNLENLVPIHAATASSTRSRSATPDIEDFTAFSTQYKTLKANSIALSAENNEIKTLRALLRKSEKVAEEASINA